MAWRYGMVVDARHRTVNGLRWDRETRKTNPRETNCLMTPLDHRQNLATWRELLLFFLSPFFSLLVSAWMPSLAEKLPGSEGKARARRKAKIRLPAAQSSPFSCHTPRGNFLFRAGVKTRVLAWFFSRHERHHLLLLSLYPSADLN
ncbi:hypothetical protein E2C01_045536 [Portunus trituberculatus]|uniref:Uncharacterized protein n=1 Tax=Portunus trituberculatus TaxID=210409 RepID=A0A5B7G5A9_PORTR|nr:hypothetical protein [Portunus trituberculatus]